MWLQVMVKVKIAYHVRNYELTIIVCIHIIKNEKESN